MAKEDRLTASPVEYIRVEGGEGWLYLWNNGDTQMLWATRPNLGLTADQSDTGRPAAG